jgi:hypothetical protein
LRLGEGKLVERSSDVGAVAGFDAQYAAGGGKVGLVGNLSGGS